MNARVDQKLYFARLALDAVQDCDSAAAPALLEAALFHLVTAYRIYLDEIVGDPRLCGCDSARDATARCRQLELGTIPALDELALLEQNGGWPAHLLGAYTAATAALEPARSAASAIALTDITTAVGDADCRSWLDQFQRLLQRQREHAQEY